MTEPKQIDPQEWWFKGCFIQKQPHPLLDPFHVFQDTEEQKTVGTCDTFAQAKKLCTLHEVKYYKYGYKGFC